MSSNPTDLYAGDMSATASYAALENDPAAVLIDVRTRAEWSYVGLPMTKAIGKPVTLVAWQDTAEGALPEDFTGRLGTELARLGAGPDTALYFLCRSGARSRSAAIAMTAAGWSKCFNIAAGFEGPLDAEGHRGTIAGWKAEGLPWAQT